MTHLNSTTNATLVQLHDEKRWLAMNLEMDSEI